MSEASVRPGDVLGGKYRVDRVLGSGNMGVVLAASHVDLGQQVALKMMLPGKGDSVEHRERFLREARAAVRLRSQHVTRVLDVGTFEGGAPFIAMELLDGKDLAALIAERGPLAFGLAVEYVLQACEAVAEAHGAGIVHRDLKPANLFLTHDVSGAPCVKVLDFGISKLAGVDLTLTQDTQALGSPLYMSPEQMSSSKSVDARSDLWALGVILYQLVAGQTPFHADSIQALCARVLFGQPTPLDELRPGAPPGFEAVILRCLQRDREARFRDVAELARALAPFAPSSANAYVDRVARVLGGARRSTAPSSAEAPTVPRPSTPLAGSDPAVAPPPNVPVAAQTAPAGSGTAMLQVTGSRASAPPPSATPPLAVSDPTCSPAASGPTPPLAPQGTALMDAALLAVATSPAPAADDSWGPSPAAASPGSPAGAETGLSLSASHTAAPTRPDASSPEAHRSPSASSGRSRLAIVALAALVAGGVAAAASFANRTPAAAVAPESSHAAPERSAAPPPAITPAEPASTGTAAPAPVPIAEPTSTEPTASSRPAPPAAPAAPRLTGALPKASSAPAAPAKPVAPNVSYDERN